LLNSKQLFNGKNHYNNNISINLKKNTVDFKPIKMKSYMPYLHFLSLHLYVPVKVIPYTVFLFVLFYLEFALYHEIQLFMVRIYLYNLRCGYYFLYLLDLLCH